MTIRYTNIEGKRHKNDFRKTLDVIELKCFIGCLLHKYTLHQNMHSLDTFFYPVEGSSLVWLSLNKNLSKVWKGGRGARLVKNVWDHIRTAPISQYNTKWNKKTSTLTIISYFDMFLLTHYNVSKDNIGKKWWGPMDPCYLFPYKKS